MTSFFHNGAQTNVSMTPLINFIPIVIGSVSIKNQDLIRIS